MSDQLPLARQIEMVFREIRDELSHVTSGIIFIQIRNNVIGKFGIKHDPLESRDGAMETAIGGLTEAHQRLLTKMAVDSLRYKNHWTHGEIFYEFAIKKNMLCASVQFESNYNMANLLAGPAAKPRYESA